jgi:glutaminyl-tRNA synthetase
MAVLKPLKLVIDNYPEGQTEEFDADNNPEDPSTGTRKVKFSKVLFIEQGDFLEEPPKGYFRLSTGKEVRLKHAYYVTCTSAVKDAAGNITEVHCTYDPQSRGGGTPDNRKVKGTLHWVSATDGIDAEIRMYDRLFTTENPDVAPEGSDFLVNMNPNSLETITTCKLEPSLAAAKPGQRFQFIRHGYFTVDKDSKPGKIVFNRTVTLKDSWGKIEKSQKKQ